MMQKKIKELFPSGPMSFKKNSTLTSEANRKTKNSGSKSLNLLKAQTSSKMKLLIKIK
jgi:hypothetical protein